jgi:4a-hydroxytetrahydrobiopterin dehydratase
MPSRKLLSPAEIARHAAEVPNWQIVDEKKLTHSFIFPDFQKGLDFVNQVGEIAERQGHHPDIQLSWGRVGIEISTHDAGGLTELDFLLASSINHLG